MTSNNYRYWKQLFGIEATDACHLIVPDGIYYRPRYEVGDEQ